MNGTLLNSLYAVLQKRIANIAKLMVTKVITTTLNKTGDLQNYLSYVGITPAKISKKVNSTLESSGVLSMGSRKLTSAQKQYISDQNSSKEKKKSKAAQLKEEARKKIEEEKSKLIAKGKLAVQKEIANVKLKINSAVSKLRSLYESYLSDLNSIAIGFANIGTGSYDLVEYFIECAPSIIGTCAMGPTVQPVLIVTQLSNLQKKASDLGTEISKVKSLINKLQLKTIAQALIDGGQEEAGKGILTFVEIVESVLTTAKTVTSIVGVISPENLINLAAGAIDAACEKAESALNQAFDELEEKINSTGGTTDSSSSSSNYISGIGTDSSIPTDENGEIDFKNLLKNSGYTVEEDLEKAETDERAAGLEDLAAQAESDQASSLSDANNSSLEEDIKPYFCEHFVYNGLEFTKSSSNNLIPTYPYQVDSDYYLQKGITVSTSAVDPDTGEVTNSEDILWEYVLDSNGNKIIPSVKHCAYSYQYLENSEDSESSSSISDRAKGSSEELNSLFESNGISVKSTSDTMNDSKEADSSSIKESEAPESITKDEKLTDSTTGQTTSVTKTLKLTSINDFKVMKSCSNECKYCIKFKKRDE